jgi:hypothetical protein
MNDAVSLVEETGYYGGKVNFDDYLIQPDTKISKGIPYMRKRVYKDYEDMCKDEMWLNTFHFIYVNRFTFLDVDDNMKFVPTGKLTKNNMAYLWFPHIHYDADEEYISRSMVYRSMKIIYALWMKKPDGWIIDLRANTGGIVEYFIVCISQFIDEFDVRGYDRKGNENSLIATHGNKFKMTIEGDTVFEIEFPFKLDIEASNINVLIDNNTASAAEIITLLLRKYCGAKVYGQDSYGVVSLMVTASYHDYTLVYPVSKIKFDGFENEKIKPDIYGVPEHLYP